jgi:hypothetical protein
MRIVRIDVENVRLAKEVGEQQLVLVTTPFATDPDKNCVIFRQDLNADLYSPDD